MQHLKSTLLFLLVLGIAGSAYLWPLRAALLPPLKSLSTVQAELLPHYELHLPTGAGPFATVLVFNGCGGSPQALDDYRAQWLVEQGYAALMVDSFSGRSYDFDAVCEGSQFWGRQRVADVYAALAHARSLPQVDAQRLALVGYSHGAWAILDSLSYAGQSAYGQEKSERQDLSSIKAVVAYYPYCAFPAKHAAGWDVDIPVLALLSGSDKVVNTQACLDVFATQEKRGLPLQSRWYAEAPHSFDEIGHAKHRPKIAAAAELELARMLQQHLR